MGSVVIYSLVHSYLSLYWGEVSKLRLDTVVLSLTCYRNEFLIHRQSRSQSSCLPGAYPLYQPCLPCLKPWLILWFVWDCWMLWWISKWLEVLLVAIRYKPGLVMVVCPVAWTLMASKLLYSKKSSYLGTWFTIIRLMTLNFEFKMKTKFTVVFISQSESFSIACFKIHCDNF